MASNRIEQIKQLLDSFDQPTKKKIIAYGIGLITGCAVAALLLSHATIMQAQGKNRTKDLQNLVIAQVHYRDAVASNNRLKARIQSLAANETALSIIQSTGLPSKSAILTKPLTRVTHPNIVEEPSEVTVTGLSMNEVVNLLYLIENGSKPMAIRHIHLTSRFSDPSRIDLTMTTSLYRPLTPSSR